MGVIRVILKDYNEIFTPYQGVLMARKKPYSITLGIIDLILVLLTGPVWLVVMLVRELYMRK